MKTKRRIAEARTCSVRKDPVVNEVRRIRHELDQECRADPDRYFRYFQTVQAGLGRRLVRGKSVPLPRKIRRDESVVSVQT